NGDRVFNSPATGLAMIEADLKGLTADKVNAALRTAFTGNGPLLFISSPKPIDGGEAAFVSAFKEAESTAIAQAAPPQIAPWPYTDFGAAGTVAETRKVDDLDVTFIRFANGVRLTVKPTKFRADQISVSVSLPGGELAFPKDKMVIDSGAFVGGGLEALAYLDM